MNLDKIFLKIQNSFSIGYLLLGFLLLFIFWALFFDIDKSVRAQATVIASKNNQVIQVVDGGVLANLLVIEGQFVKKGELLAILEKQRIEASYQQIGLDVAYFTALINRLDAQINNKALIFNTSLDAYSDLTSTQKSLFLQQKNTQVKRLKLLNKILKLNQDRMKISQKLLKTGDIAMVEVLNLEEKIFDIQTKILETINQYQDRLKSEKEKAVLELGKNRSKLNQQQDFLKHSNIYTPISGVIKDLKITTLGGVLKTGEVIMEISPIDDEVILEAKINPSDIADIAQNMQALIKLDAFDYTIFGGLDGKVNYISSDTLLEKDQSGREKSYYQVNLVITSSNAKIKPKLGMSATIEIKTGERSLFHYLTKPIIRGFSGALSEK